MNDDTAYTVYLPLLRRPTARPITAIHVPTPTMIEGTAMFAGGKKSTYIITAKITTPIATKTPPSVFWLKIALVSEVK